MPEVPSQHWPGAVVLSGAFAEQFPVPPPTAAPTNLQTTAQGDTTDRNSYPLFVTDCFRHFLKYLKMHQSAPKVSITKITIFL